MITMPANVHLRTKGSFFCLLKPAASKTDSTELNKFILNAITTMNHYTNLLL